MIDGAGGRRGGIENDFQISQGLEVPFVSVEFTDGRAGLGEAMSSLGHAECERPGRPPGGESSWEKKLLREGWGLGS